VDSNRFMLRYWRPPCVLQTVRSVYTNILHNTRILIQAKQTPRPESASELYRPSDRLLSAELVTKFAEIGCHVVSVTDPYCRNHDFLDRSSYFFFQAALQLYSRG
jgi:hypothetical protein